MVGGDGWSSAPDSCCYGPTKWWPARRHQPQRRYEMALKADPWCLQRILDPRKISVMALNSTHPRHGTSLILYLGAVVMPKCSGRAQSLPVGIGASASKDSTSSTSRYILSTSVSLGGGVLFIGLVFDVIILMLLLLLSRCALSC
jgi:hypothetical protein